MLYLLASKDKVVSASKAKDLSHLQLQGSQVQLDPHLQPPFSAPTPISDPSKCLHNPNLSQQH